MLAQRPLSGRVLARIKRNPWRNRKIKPFETLVAIVQRYCTDATLHGLRYAVDPRLHPIERCLWLLVFVVHFVVAVRVIVYLTINLQVTYLLHLTCTVRKLCLTLSRSCRVFLHPIVASPSGIIARKAVGIEELLVY